MRRKSRIRVRRSRIESPLGDLGVATTGQPTGASRQETPTRAQPAATIRPAVTLLAGSTKRLGRQLNWVRNWLRQVDIEQRQNIR